MDMYGRTPPSQSAHGNADTGLEGLSLFLLFLIHIPHLMDSQLSYFLLKLNFYHLCAESMWRLGLGSETYPERPAAPDCPYYMRTGVCGYGSRCRYNHPPDRATVKTLPTLLEILKSASPFFFNPL